MVVKVNGIPIMNIQYTGFTILIAQKIDLQSLEKLITNQFSNRKTSVKRETDRES